MLATADIDQLFTFSSLAVLQFAAVAAFVGPNIAGYVLRLGGRARIVLAVVVGLAVQFAAAGAADPKPVVKSWLVAAVNGLLIAIAALGVNEVIAGRSRGAARADEADAVELPAKRRALLTSWLG